MSLKFIISVSVGVRGMVQVDVILHFVQRFVFCIDKQVHFTMLRRLRPIKPRAGR